MNRNEYSVLAVCKAINDHVKCSGERLPDVELAALRAWLDWRTTSEGWVKSVNPVTEKYDDCVWELAMAALAMTEEDA